jgi:hypothetical protein
MDKKLFIFKVSSFSEAFYYNKINISEKFLTLCQKYVFATVFMQQEDPFEVSPEVYIFADSKP